MMKLLGRLERKWKRFGIRNLMAYIVGANFLVFLLGLFPQYAGISSYLILSPERVLQGEVWRLVTFLFIPPATNLFWILFTLYFYYMIGRGLEQEWGSFKFCAYYFIGMVCTAASAFLTGGAGTPVYLNLSLFLAFSYIYPHYEVRIFFILPVKMKWLGWITAAFLAYTLVIGNATVRFAILAALFNFALFFGEGILRFVRQKILVRRNRTEFARKIPNIRHFHCCQTCGVTEFQNKNMEFRYCSRCEGNMEYCMDHLDDHEHVKKDSGEKS